MWRGTWAVPALSHRDKLPHALAYTGYREYNQNAVSEGEARMNRESVLAPQAPKPVAPLSHAIKAGGFLFLSGQIATDPATGELIAGDISVQTERVLRNLEAVLQAAGSSTRQVVKTTVFLTDMRDFGKMNEVYARYFPEEPPARTTVQVASLSGGANIEIDLIAMTAE